MAEEKNEKKKSTTPRKRTPKKNMSLLPDEGQMLQYSLFDTKQKINESTSPYTYTKQNTPQKY